MSTIRLDKYLSDAGIGTRSQVKNYIKKNMVMVNDSIISTPDTKINPVIDIVTFQGNIVSISDFEYYILNKPAGFVSATKDNVSPTVLSLIESPRHDLFPVGRLDKDTEGLLLITNDGALAHKLLSPKHHIEKTYYAVIDDTISQNDIDAFAKGLEIGDEDLTTAMPAKLHILTEPGRHFPDNFSSFYIKETKNNSEISTHEKIQIYQGYDNAKSTYQNISYVYITIVEGKYHQIKRMFKHIGKKVIYLKRISFGNLSLPSDLSIGQSRPLTEDELNLLMR